jgi:TrmH family RNA methyltransferase
LLTSTKNPQVVSASELSSARARKERGLHLAEGRKIVLEALEHADVVEVFATVQHQDVLERAGRTSGHPVRTHLVDERVLARLADASTPQGVVAVVRTPAPDARIPSTGPVLVLDGVSDPGNVGTLVRTAAAFGVPVVVTGQGAADPFGPKAVRASAGACYLTPILRREQLATAVEELRGEGRRLLGLDAKGKVPLPELVGDREFALVLGGEPRGLGTSTRDVLDLTVAIPIVAAVESLNVAAAGAIALHAIAGGTRLEG